MPIKVFSMVYTMLIICLWLTAGTGLASERQKQVTLYFFWGEGCPHCEKAKPFLEKLAARYRGLDIRSHEVFHNSDNRDLLKKMAQSAGKEATGVPVFFIGKEMITGFSEETGRVIEKEVNSCIMRGGCDIPAQPGTPPREKPGTVRLPLLGEISAASVSLPFFTVIIACLDSFNPCTFFVLLFLLSLLLHTHSRKRMALIGGTFVLFSAIVYFLFMTAWLTLFLVAGSLPVITAIAGTIALLIAVINIKDFFLFGKGISLSIPEKAKPGLFARMRNLLGAGSLPAMLGGTIFLAVAANSYELLCTAGFPLVFTRVLTLRSLSFAEYYAYLALYNIVYIIPLAVIVSVFVSTLGSRKLTRWQGRVLKLLSGLMMLFLGAVLLVNPGLLNNALVSAALLALSLTTTALVTVITKNLRPGIDKT